MRVSCSIFQSQALAASSYVPAKYDKVEESVVDLGEVRGGECIQRSLQNALVSLVTQLAASACPISN